VSEREDLWPLWPGRALQTRRRAARRRRALAGSAILLVLALVMVVVATAGGSHPAGVIGRHRESVRLDERGQAGHRAGISGRRTSGLLARENRAIDRLLARQSFISVGGRERREIALSFDDGPGPYTPRLLDQLNRLRVPATFFEIGFMIHYFHAALTRELHMHAVIGDHTEIHPMMAALSPAAQASQILTQTGQLARYRAPFPRLYRPPYGSFNPATFAILHHLRMLMVLWSVDTDDYLQPGVAVIVHRALAGAQPGAIILMHDAGGTRTQTIAALPLIVHALRHRGYKLVTIPQLILQDPPTGRVPATPTNLSGG